MAHSLGNMVVSSMIHDYGLEVSQYLMCNSAVPAEAYDTSLSLRAPQLVHSDWEEYPTNSWTASWHTLFKDEPNSFERIRKPYDQNKCLVVRSRCNVDKDGNLTSFSYSVIHKISFCGEINGSGGVCVIGAFNPTPNDTNLEPKR